MAPKDPQIVCIKTVNSPSAKIRPTALTHGWVIFVATNSIPHARVRRFMMSLVVRKIFISFVNANGSNDFSIHKKKCDFIVDKREPLMERCDGGCWYLFFFFDGVH